MRQRQQKGFPNISSLFMALAFLQCGCAWSRQQSVPSSPVVYQHFVRRHPNFAIHVVTVDLSDLRVSVRVARGGPDPDGDGPWTTTLEPASEIASREGFDIAVNGDFFLAQGTRDIEGRNTRYVRGKFATPEGLAMTDGQLWHRSAKAFPFLAITTNHTACFGNGVSTDALDPAVCQILSGRQLLVSNGVALDYTSRLATNRHPRTAAGIDRTGTRLTLMVVDGRQPRLSIGMTLRELSMEMIRLGCYNAINLDGGGSSTMVYRDPNTHFLKVVNSPSDTRERAVADVLGITVRAPMPVPY
ncbi:MAG: phosphodiester glycosidase family protein [Limisphaerales bacterium]